MNWILKDAWHVVGSFETIFSYPCTIFENLALYEISRIHITFFFLKKLKKDQLLIRLSVDKEGERNLFFLSKLLLFFFLLLLSMWIDWFKFLFTWNIWNNPHVVSSWLRDDVSDSYWNFQSNSFFYFEMWLLIINGSGFSWKKMSKF